ncbi:hypothetical protein [Paenibacillus hexagrammi]|uniref:Uncharacterized protein n=1 Tax=Paenibacillus hexagrammi TaxID=2908839 RepID=A0ABY3SER8_9BACL|nr:hypothetical protein [Paenibacillus sp. YPD9-1]UJF31734.1 hypothetical protein L0M14_18365 [Paenibacillus sp. YPD9-1]
MNFHVDWNEWFIVICSVIAMTVFFRIRKHFDAITIVILWTFNVAFVASSDYELAAPPFELYYCGDNTTYEPITAVAHVFLYTPFSFMFLFLYDKWNLREKKNRMRLVFYIAGWTAFSIFFEWLQILNGFFVYTGWKLYYSIPVYPVSALILIKVYHFIGNHLPLRKKA